MCQHFDQENLVSQEQQGAHSSWTALHLLARSIAAKGCCCMLFRRHHSPSGKAKLVRRAGRVCYWDLVEETLVETVAAHSSVVCSLAMHPAGSLLVTSSTDSTIKVWQ